MSTRSKAGRSDPADPAGTGAGPAPAAPGPEAGPDPGPPGAAGWRGRTRRHGPAALTGLALGLLALGPGLGRGYLLSYDMVFVPRPPFSAALLGLSGGPARAPCRS
jgi:hypothetical protein